MLREPEKPEDRFFANLLAQILRAAASRIDLGSSSIKHDLSTLDSRIHTEGSAFYTHTLPSLGKSLDKALSSDMPYQAPAGFKASKYPWPRFLQGFWRCIFDVDGRVIETPTCLEKQVEAVRAIRQICFLAYKLEGSHTPESEVACLDNFVITDASLPLAINKDELTAVTRRALTHARELISRVLANEELVSILPKHGPGAVATGEKPWEKKNFSRFYEQLDEEYPYSDYFFFNYTHLCDSLESLEALTPEREATAKVVLVPKDSRGPRIISMEPLEIQWIQQGMLERLVQVIEHPNSITSGLVNFTNQEVNRGLALSNSEGGEYITIDLKDASDRVSVALVEALYPEHIVRKLMAARSSATILPDGRRVELRKFAPMGSAVCFPIEALTFWALAAGTVLHKDPSSFLERPVYVYGDDIVIHQNHYTGVASVYEELSLKLNRDKCCIGRFFRESCGCDAFRKKDVTPLRMRHSFKHIKSPATALSLISTLRGLKERGYADAADILQARIIENLGLIPRTNRSREASLPYAIYEPLWLSAEIREFNKSNFRHRFSKRWHREEVFIPTPTVPTFQSGDPDWSELLRLASTYFSKERGVSEAALACRHTTPRVVKMKGRWVALDALLA